MPTSEQPESVAGAAASNDRLATLVALRNTLARSIDECESMRDLAALSRQMTDVLAQIDAVAPPEQKGDAVDEIAARRAARRSGSATGAGRTKRTS